MTNLRTSLSIAILLSITVLASLAPSHAMEHATDHSMYGPGAGPLVEWVREATIRFRDVDAAIAEGYAGGACVSGPNEGAMGIHYINGGLLGDGVVDPSHPEALIYEPMPNGELRLVGVEYITLADVWHTVNGAATPPTLGGHLFHYAGTPNRYAIPAFYEIHVWAWRNNPKGTFSDWNPNVSCAALSAQ